MLILLVTFFVALMLAILNDSMKLTHELKQKFDEKLVQFYSNKYPVASLLDTQYINTCNHVSEKEYDDLYKELHALAEQMEEKYKALSILIPTKHLKQVIQEVRGTMDAFRRQMKIVKYLPSSLMIDTSNYGQINKTYLNNINSMSRREAEGIIIKYEQAYANTKAYDKCVQLNPEELIKCVWFFACEKQYSAAELDKAASFFRGMCKQNHCDLLIAKLYAMKRLGGEGVLRDQVRDLLKTQKDAKVLTWIASGFMWMNAYQSESTVLQYMLTSGMEMTNKAQERLHALMNGGDKTPDGFEVQSSANTLYFDISALAWKDDEFVGLFENLAFQDKTLGYSLALRDENKDLFVPQGINVPNTGSILTKFGSVFAEEYGAGVAARLANCVALSGSGEEKMDGILVSTNECKQMGILIHIARIGKKLIIKFYTLFMPTGSDLAVQKQQVLSMHKKLSPTVTMWESSLKDTMLMAVEQLINTHAQTPSATASNGIIQEEPIF